MKKNFFSGLFILLPSAITIIATIFIINLLATPFQGIIESMLQLNHVVSKILSLIVLISGIIAIGFLARLVIIHSILSFCDSMIHRIPIINKIYKLFQESIQVIFKSSKSTFSQVVLVSFPKTTNTDDKVGYALGFIKENQSQCSKKTPVSVFIPCALNPSIGYMVLYQYSDIIFIDTPVETAFKSIISCGVMLPDFTVQKNQCM